MRVSLLGPSEHVTPRERDALVAALEARGHAVTLDERGAVPDAGTEILVLDTKTRVDRAVLGRLPRLRLVVTTTSGHDHLDLDALAHAGVVAARCPLARRDAVVDTSVAMALALLRRLPRTTADLAAGRWTRAAMRDLGPRLVAGARVLIVGHGVIGRRAAEVWRALGARVTAHDPAQPGLPPLEPALAEADVVTLHCSLTDSSRGLFGARNLARLGRGAVLVNTARGECVDLAALAEARHLGGVGLDVFDPEPPADLSALGALGNLLLSPHAAGVHPDVGRLLVEETLAAVDAHARGAPPPHPLSPSATL